MGVYDVLNATMGVSPTAQVTQNTRRKAVKRIPLSAVPIFHYLFNINLAFFYQVCYCQAIDKNKVSIFLYVFIDYII